MMSRLLDSLSASHMRMAPRPTVSADDVCRAYQLLFGRDPESDQVIEVHRQQNPDVWSLLRGLMTSPEFAARAEDFVRPCTTLDWTALRARFEQREPPTRPGYVTDFLGLHTHESYLARGAVARDGRIDGLPVAGDAQCSISEWAAGLRGVELGRADFVAVELGAGWGAWMAILCRAARIRGATSIRAVGCEADPGHCQMLRHHLEVNGFRPDEYRLFEGAVAPSRGVALFPVSSDSSQDWGMRPIFCRSDREADAVLHSSTQLADYRGFAFERFQRVNCYALVDIFAGLDHVDVMHVDVQGSEFDLVSQNLDLLTKRVGYLILGTHTRHVEGLLIDLLSRSGWRLELEEPCSFELHSGRFAPLVDGVQGWRNLAIHPDPPDAA